MRFVCPGFILESSLDCGSGPNAHVRDITHNRCLRVEHDVALAGVHEGGATLGGQGGGGGEAAEAGRWPSEVHRIHFQGPI